MYLRDRNHTPSGFSKKGSVYWETRGTAWSQGLRKGIGRQGFRSSCPSSPLLRGALLPLRPLRAAKNVAPTLGLTEVLTAAVPRELPELRCLVTPGRLHGGVGDGAWASEVWAAELQLRLEPRPEDSFVLIHGWRGGRPVNHLGPPPGPSLAPPAGQRVDGLHATASPRTPQGWAAAVQPGPTPMIPQQLSSLPSPSPEHPRQSSCQNSSLRVKLGEGWVVSWDL